MVVGRALGLAGAFACILGLSCGGRSLREGEASGTGGAGGAGGAGQGGSHIGMGGGWKGGTVNPDDASSVVVEAIGYGYAGASCEDDGAGNDPAGILTKGTTRGLGHPSEFTDSCDAEGNLVEYFCTTECTSGSKGPPYSNDFGSTGCMMNGNVASIRVTCDGVCIDGRCGPPQ
jgi:hypothetical protein